MTSTTLATGVAQLESLIASVGSENAAAPTPCSQWTVQDLLDHVIHSTAGLAQMLRGEDVDWSAPVVHHDDALAQFRRRGAELVRAGDGGPAGVATAELAVHAWDLASALGRGTDDLDPEVAQEGEAFMRENLTDERRTGAFDPERPAPDGANAYERIAAFAGRTVRRS